MKKIICVFLLSFNFTMIFSEPFVDSDIDTLNKQDASFFNKLENKEERNKLIEIHKNMTEERKSVRGLDDLVSKAQEAKDIESYESGDKQKLREKHASFWTHVFGKVFTKDSGNISDRWKQYNAAKSAEKIIEQRQEEIKNTPLDGMTRDFIQKLQKPYEVQALTTSQIKNLCRYVFRTSNASEQYRIQAFTPEQIKFLRPGQVKALNVDSLTKEQIQVLSKNQIQAIDFNNVKKLSFFTPQQISFFTSKQIEHLKEPAILSLTAVQLENLNISQLDVISTRILSVDKYYSKTGRLSKLMNDQLIEIVKIKNIKEAALNKIFHKMF